MATALILEVAVAAAWVLAAATGDQQHMCAVNGSCPADAGSDGQTWDEEEMSMLQRKSEISEPVPTDYEAMHPDIVDVEDTVKFDVSRFKITQDDPYKMSPAVGLATLNFEMGMQELGNGAKLGHWRWWVFPPPFAEGSFTGKFYSIRSSDELHAYIQDETLRPRLIESYIAVLNKTKDKTIWEIFDGHRIDAYKYATDDSQLEDLVTKDVPIDKVRNMTPEEREKHMYTEPKPAASRFIGDASNFAHSVLLFWKEAQFLGDAQIADLADQLYHTCFQEYQDTRNTDFKRYPDGLLSPDTTLQALHASWDSENAKHQDLGPGVPWIGKGDMTEAKAVSVLAQRLKDLEAIHDGNKSHLTVPPDAWFPGLPRYNKSGSSTKEQVLEEFNKLNLSIPSAYEKELANRAQDTR